MWVSLNALKVKLSVSALNVWLTHIATSKADSSSVLRQKGYVKTIYLQMQLT